MNKRPLAWITGLIIVALAVFVLAKVLPKSQGPKTVNPGQNPPLNEIPPLQVGPNAPGTGIAASPLTGNDLTAALPAGFPKEAGKILLSLKLNDTKAGQTKVLLTTATSKSLADAFALYKSYLSAKAWNITKTTDNAVVKALSADKAAAHLEISFSYDGGSKSNVVVVAYTVPLR